MATRPVTVSAVGAGNVATHLVRALHAAGAEIRQVAARSEISAQRLADAVGAKTTDTASLDTCVDYVLIAVSDRAVEEVARTLRPGRAVVAHTSGSIPLEHVAAAGHRAAVIYPLQTFSRGIPVDITQVPIFTEAVDGDTLAVTDALARMLSRHVYHADSNQRRALHVAGVLTSNFPVYLIEMARQALAKAGFPLEVVRPLAEATIQKAFETGPRDALTGPARRGDMAVTRLQAESLPPQHKAIYEAITNAIINDYRE